MTVAGHARRAPALTNPHVLPVRREAMLSASSAVRRVRLAWLLLFFNVLGYTDSAVIVRIPHAVTKPLLQAALPAALLVSLSVNPRGLFRRNTYLLALTVLAGAALALGIQNQFYLGSTYRALRLLEFVLVLWLLTPWWEGPQRPLLRCHLWALGVVLASVAGGILVAPGKAFSFQGRLSGVIYPIATTQVAHYAAVATGLVIVLWMSGGRTTRRGVLAVLIGFALLVLTHTRTALVAMLAGVLVGGISLFLGRARVRKAFLTAGTVGGLLAVAYAPVIGEWLRRGEGTNGVNNLSGRTNVWGDLLAEPRSTFHELFGFGLSNKSFDGLPIDSSWLSTYQDLGMFGLALLVLMLGALLFGAMALSRSAERALVLFILVYGIIASITETGLGDASPYLLDLAVAASLLVPARGGSSLDLA